MISYSELENKKWTQYNETNADAAYERKKKKKEKIATRIASTKKNVQNQKSLSARHAQRRRIKKRERENTRV